MNLLRALALSTPPTENAALAFVSPIDCDVLQLSSLTNATHRKQVIYEGKFIRSSGNEPDIEFEVTPAQMDKWAIDGNELLKDGVRCSMPLEHVNMGNPEWKRGEVLQFERAYDSKGRDSLFIHFSYTSEEAALKLAHADVSLWAPEEYTNAATGKKYIRPIRHVAFTDNPVIPGLDKSEALSLSLQPPKDTSMSYIALAKKLGIALQENATEEDAEQAIIDANTAAKDDTKPEDTKPDDVKPDAGKPDASKSDDIKPTNQPLAAGFVTMAVDSRQTKIDQLVQNGNITPATAKELKSRYADRQKVTLALSHDGSFNDGFNDIVEVLATNKALSLSERSGQQGQDPRKSSLVENAKRRAEAAKAR